MESLPVPTVSVCVFQQKEVGKKVAHKVQVKLTLGVYNWKIIIIKTFHVILIQQTSIFLQISIWNIITKNPGLQ